MTADADPNLDRGDLSPSNRSTSSGRSFPISRASTCSPTRTGKVIYVGKAISIRKRVAGHFSGKSTRGMEMVDQIASIDFLVTETEAEALLAEQQFIKRHRPRFNIRLRDDKSYPYIGDQPRRGVPARLLHPRAPPLAAASTSARTRRPSACARRSTCSAACFSTAPARGRSPAGGRACPCLDYYIKRCAAPCVGYVDREEYRRGIDAIVDFLSGRYRDVERDLERKMAEAAGDRGVRARRGATATVSRRCAR